jgi:hypothetical protein
MEKQEGNITKQPLGMQVCREKEGRSSKDEKKLNRS